MFFELLNRFVWTALYSLSLTFCSSVLVGSILLVFVIIMTYVMLSFRSSCRVIQLWITSGGVGLLLWNLCSIIPWFGFTHFDCLLLLLVTSSVLIKVSYCCLYHFCFPLLCYYFRCCCYGNSCSYTCRNCFSIVVLSYCFRIFNTRMLLVYQELVCFLVYPLYSFGLLAL